MDGDLKPADVDAVAAYVWAINHHLARRCGSSEVTARTDCSEPSVSSFYNREESRYSAASLCPNLALSLWISSSAASEITVPGGKIASAPALYSAS